MHYQITLLVFLVLLALPIFSESESSMNTTHDKEIVTRKVNPPLLSPEHIGKRILCVRPERNPTPAFDVQIVQSKIVVRNYGHGGSGWTLAPGSAQLVVKKLGDFLAAQSEGEHSYSKDEPIAVIGAGVIGLFSALELVNKGHTNITVVAEKFDGLTSHNAGAGWNGGLYIPAFTDKNEGEAGRMIRKVAEDSLSFYRSVLADKLHPLHEGVELTTVYSKTKRQTSLSEPQEVLLDFQNGITRRMFAYNSDPQFQPNVLLSKLRRQLESSSPKVRFVEGKIESIVEDLPDYRIVFNCAGVGARDLLPQPDGNATVSVGHAFLLKNQPHFADKYVIVDHPAGRSIFLEFNPKRWNIGSGADGSTAEEVGFIGGSYIEDGLSLPEEKHAEYFEAVLQNAIDFFWGGSVPAAQPR